MQIPPRQQAVFELTFAGALWGFGFIAAIWALRGMGPLAITGGRFALAAGLGFFAMLVSSGRRHFRADQFRLAFVPGLLICSTLIFQTWGLQYTTATKSAFITTLYVLIVPLVERFFLGRKLPRFHLAWVCLALIGVALICGFSRPRGLDETERLNIGDLLTLACSLTASLHILWFGLRGNRIRSSFAFNNFQSLWAAPLPLLFAALIERKPQLTLENRSLIGFLALAIGSTLVAFALQVRAQKHISPSLASLLFLLESPFSALFAIFFLNESLSPSQWLGGGIILFAAGASSLKLAP